MAVMVAAGLVEPAAAVTVALGALGLGVWLVAGEPRAPRPDRGLGWVLLAAATVLLVLAVPRTTMTDPAPPADPTPPPPAAPAAPSMPAPGHAPGPAPFPAGPA